MRFAARPHGPVRPALVRGLSPPAALLGVTLLALASAAPIASAAPEEQAPPVYHPPGASIHRHELELWNRSTPSAGPASGVGERGRAPQTSSPTLEPSAPSREVHGYHPWWMGDAYLEYDWSLISTIAFFALEIDVSGNVANAHEWPWSALVDSAHASGTRVIVTAALHDRWGLTALLGNPASRATAIGNIVDAAVAGNADGVNVDFEGLDVQSRWPFLVFLDELGEALLAALDEPYLSVATPGINDPASYDLREIASRCNYLMVIAYDYHWPGNATAGPVAPVDGWGTYNVRASIRDYIAAGVPRAKILLGVPYYGYDWPTADATMGARTLGYATVRYYSDAYRDAQMHGRRWDTPAASPWYRYAGGTWRQCWYEDGVSLGIKYDIVNQEGLGGVGIWALGYDGRQPHLRNALSSAFGDGPVGPNPPPWDFSILRLTPPTPNPLRRSTALSLIIYETARVRLGVYDIAGRQCDLLDDRIFTPGEYDFSWQPTGEIPTGRYFIRAGTDLGSIDVPILRVR